MVDSLALKLLLGSLLGFLTGLGVGGGSLLMVWLTGVMAMDPLTARGVNLLFFLPGAAAALALRTGRGMIRWKQVLPPAAAGCMAAALCSRLSTVVDNTMLRKAFGILLIIAGIRELLWKPKN